MANIVDIPDTLVHNQPMSGVGDVPDINLATDVKDEITLRNKLLYWVNEAECSTPEYNWRIESEEDYRMYAGFQDTKEVADKLRDQRRPNSTFNKIMPKINMLVGLAAQSNRAPYIFSVAQEDEAMSEIMNGAMKHYRRNMRIKRIENECFEHAIKSGRSYQYYWVSGSNPFKPELKSKRLAGRDVLVDPLSQEYDMSDARYIVVDKWLFAEDILAYWPQLDLNQVRSLSNTSPPHPIPFYYDEIRNKYRVSECWYRVWDKVTWFRNPLSGKIESCSPAEFKKVQEAFVQGVPGPDGKSIKIDPKQIQSAERLRKTVFYAVFSSTMIMEQGPSPYKFRGNDNDYFPIILYGAYKLEDENRWLSVIRGMKDPQRLQNTVKRQLAHLLNVAQKNILVHAVGALADEEKYKEHSSEPNFRLEINPPFWDKWKFTDQPQIPQTYNQLEQMADQDMKDVSGIQDTMLGIQTSSREPGVTAKMRQDTNIAVLYTLYDNFRESRIQGGKFLLGMIQQFVTEETMIRIEGQEGAMNIAVNQQIHPAAPKINDLSAGEYDLAVDEAVDNVTMRMTIAAMLNDFSQNNPGTIPPEMIMEYMDMPLSARRQVAQFREQQLQLELRKIDAQNQSKEAIADHKIHGKIVDTGLKGHQKSQEVAKPKEGKKGGK